MPPRGSSVQDVLKGLSLGPKHLEVGNRCGERGGRPPHSRLPATETFPGCGLSLLKPDKLVTVTVRGLKTILQEDTLGFVSSETAIMALTGPFPPGRLSHTASEHLHLIFTAVYMRRRPTFSVDQPPAQRRPYRTPSLRSRSLRTAEGDSGAGSLGKGLSWGEDQARFTSPRWSASA